MNLAHQRARLAQATAFPIPFSMAFQPVVRRTTGEVFAYEALVRGQNGEGAGQVLAHLTASNRHDFDGGVRSRALELAKKLDMARTGALLTINILASAIPDPEACAQAALEGAAAAGMRPDQVVLEFTETDQPEPEHLQQVIATARAAGLRTAIDDFGAGWSGLSLLARFQPDLVKLDMELVRGIENCRVRRAIVASVVRMTEELELTLIGEGVETAEEAEALSDLGIALMQGYFFARPAFEALPLADVLAASATTTAG